MASPFLKIKKKYSCPLLPYPSSKGILKLWLFSEKDHTKKPKVAFGGRNRKLYALLHLMTKETAYTGACIVFPCCHLSSLRDSLNPSICIDSSAFLFPPYKGPSSFSLPSHFQGCLFHHIMLNSNSWKLTHSFLAHKALHTT